MPTKSDAAKQAKRAKKSRKDKERQAKARAKRAAEAAGDGTASRPGPPDRLESRHGWKRGSGEPGGPKGLPPTAR